MPDRSMSRGGLREDSEEHLHALGRPVEGQDPSVTANTLLSLAQKYRKLHVDRLHLVIAPVYDHTFDLDAGPTSTA